ncbi:cellulose synthase/poly-beta-1,6-N-acetylglucosamine synthase-like glycosyltransferase [Lewinella marina]|uniref:Cellulose synthase n=1 Tax=Neolewinella marina TaxID=438751 RepID=A0A2G0CIM3_9BACT|nr:glycosyltransferase [Neolewinella marina]NJB85082.1 cellulose synthase/poly-beta-1,6-N-acetylglucosamine synthase-like glycosyltransferase [Neolewinella marina]PHK99777.1 cellulose synthase [Neolewinella marina]
MTVNDPVVRNPTPRELIIIRLLVVTGVLCILNFCYFFFQPQYYGHPLLFGLLCIILVYGLVRDLTLWYYYSAITVPETPPLEREFTVDILTTYFPGEPYEMIVTTLKAIQAIHYPHTTYLCDEANDPYLRGLCEEMGIVHVTRTVRVDAKAGNINNALRQATGEICLILDPDHIPEPDFLDHIVPHFQDESIGFVQTVQAYYNKFDTLVAKGSAQQTFHFYGPMMMTMNAYGTVNAIGANCTFRRKALDSIGGHAPGLAEDMHTAMLLYREGWKSIYVPRILARGLVPATITAYFKQQLKWSRGTFDLLVKVYPRIFSRLTWRQRLHYVLLPLHYLAGVIYLLGFMIPILSLVLSEVPWTGNFGYFLILIGPILFTSFVLRFYIQKWLISDDERGFHIVGGVLEILTWWVFTLGFVYTLFNKKVPYLPTPKEGEDVTHYSLLLPNLAIGVLSLAAVAYGLWRDFTPFSIIMSGFALLNAAFMFFSIYLAFAATNETGKLRSKLPYPVRFLGRHAKRQLLWSLDAMTLTVRKLAPVLLVGVLFAALTLMSIYDREGFATIEAIPADTTMTTTPQLGIFYPAAPTGLSSLDQIDQLEVKLHTHADIISSYIPWSGSADPAGELAQLRAIAGRGSVPMITWEPWVSHFPDLASMPGAEAEKRALHYISEGHFDDYVTEFATLLRSLDKPVYLRFAHEFDNPDYPWSAAGGNTPKDFIAAWRHVYSLFQQAGATNVRWVWNPWKAEAIPAYYPGDGYVDFVGLTCLNYGPLFGEGASVSFADLYAPFYQAMKKIPTEAVIIAEFGSLGSPAEKEEWTVAARNTILDRHPEISAIVAFQSAFDYNVPPDGGEAVLDWTIDPKLLFNPGTDAAPGHISAPVHWSSSTSISRVPLPQRPIRAVGYKKGEGWSTHQYIPSRSNLEHDFGLMQRAGINTVRITNPGIYARNLFNIAGEYGLEVIMNFWIPETIDFLTDADALAELREQILEKVRENSDRPSLLHWNFGNDILSRLADHHLQPTLHAQRVAYLNWLGQLIRDMKAIDGHRPVVVMLRTAPGLEQLVDEFKLLEGPADAMGLIVPDGVSASRLARLQERFGERVVIGEVGVSELSSLPAAVVGNYAVVTNWQNEWRKTKLSFNGLLDFRGRPTPNYASLAACWTKEAPEPAALPDIAILPPALQPYEGGEYTYQALVTDGSGGWRPVREEELGTLSLEWALVKLDPYGNPIALKMLDEGSKLKLHMPAYHLRYEVMLTVTDGGYSRSVRSPLLPR